MKTQMSRTLCRLMGISHSSKRAKNSYAVRTKSRKGSLNAIQFVVAVTFLLFMSGNEIGTIEESDFTVHRADNDAVVLHLSENVDAVERALGKPSKIDITKRLNEPDYIRYYYSGLTIGFFADMREVILLRVTGSEFSTSRGIGVGLTKDDIRSAYGPDGHEWPKSLQYSLKDPSSTLDMQYLLTFWMENNVVVGIDINRG